MDAFLKAVTVEMLPGTGLILGLIGAAFILYGFGKIIIAHLNIVLSRFGFTQLKENPGDPATRKSAKLLGGLFLLTGVTMCFWGGLIVPSNQNVKVLNECSNPNPAIDPDDPLIHDSSVINIKLDKDKDISAFRDSSYMNQLENPQLFEERLHEILKEQGIDAGLLRKNEINLKDMIIPYCSCHQKRTNNLGYTLLFKVAYDFSSIDNILIPVPPASVVPIAAEPAPGEPRLFSHSGFPNGEYELNDYQKLKIGQLARSVIDEVVENKQPKTITCKGFTDANPFGGADSYSDQACIQDICQPVLWGEPCGVGRSLRSIGIGNNNTLSFARGYAGIAFFVEMIRLHDPSGKTTKLLKFEYTGCGVGSERGGDHENRRIIFEIK